MCEWNARARTIATERKKRVISVGVVALRMAARADSSWVFQDVELQANLIAVFVLVQQLQNEKC